MTPTAFVNALSELKLDNVFNPYADTCPVHDRADAASARRRNLKGYLKAALEIGVDTIWMGRDLGYRGGRRTGLALTDEYHLPEMTQRYPGSNFKQATVGPAIAERTASEIWSVLRSVALPPLLWNVFPFHPHEPGNPFSNRKFTARELQQVEILNEMLIKWLKVRRVVAIGQDALSYASRFGVEVIAIRHPSYGGIKDFRNGMSALYNIPIEILNTKQRQGSLF
ncbi:uracil-DNA glycosylase [Pseudomonas lijiangensis]|uniref:Uracil-DNA glycosylase n=1 Tax=Pseudomonas lijiangensis TaxID=2995658 RepID=A0ABX8HMQ9_9PSED|nr:MULTISPECIES: uracil-DNA glycosylase [Pseudomonas syringae group]MBX8499813.1 uracil-DNA glycosylase [Pseudomonas lijiangensis]MBX8503934.1 uracil-DNA glycosylase [Pseudomonas lijiangensis]MBX8566002.1 uracil-DNA glycosylase [Pseudomonas cichorii]QWU81685.1 uracil-DNA glycosylase [Pseudomonas lijiangensis]